MITLNAVAGALVVEYEFGDPNAQGVWERGRGAQPRSAQAVDEDFKALMGKMSPDNEPVFGALKRVVYGYLIEKELVDGAII
ncbi:MAG TPA: hypothetical protein VFH51_08550 [Myxococcota bacterium]|nr:hypothetical protein [Myxococcota bacterium]